MYFGTIHICRNLNEHYYYLISTTSVIWQIDANTNRRKQIEENKSTRFDINLSTYYMKTGAICLLVLSSYVFTALMFDSNHFGILLWKIVKPRDYNEIKPPIGKIYRKYKPMINYSVMPPKKLLCLFVNQVYDNYNKVSYLQRNKKYCHLESKLFSVSYIYQKLLLDNFQIPVAASSI